jgi:catechol 2,3-dioxygenase-like lactoylglutathione lyase family enzyme
MSAALLAAPTQFVVAQDAPLPTPGFHHLHLNSPNPEAEIAFYSKFFTSSKPDTFDGKPALKALNVWLLYNKVATKAPMNDNPQTAVWHYGWNSTDEREYLARYRSQNAPIMPLYTGFGDEFVQVSSDALPGLNGTLGRTKKELEEGKARGDKPAGGAGFGYLLAPDGSPIEFAGNSDHEYFNHVHMYQDEPACAMLWYQKHLNAPVRPARGGAPQPTEANCKVPRAADKTFPALVKDGMYRAPQAGVSFGGVAMNWYIRPGDTPLVSTLGHQADHIALSVGNLDAWLAKLKGEGVKILKEPYKFANTRAFMIEGPSKEALELVEVK